MNPSASGWIAKQLVFLKNVVFTEESTQLYYEIKKTGFIYGFSVDLLTPQPHFIHEWTVAEKTKVNLFDALALSYEAHYGHLEHFSQSAFVFYKQLLDSDYSAPASLPDEKKFNLQLEKIIHTRIKTSDSILKKKFSAVLTNALLFIDVLAFEEYCTTSASARPYASNLEFLILNVIYITLKHKEKSRQDELLLDLFEKSLRYHKSKFQQAPDLDSLAFKKSTKITEKQYILDVASLIFWNDPIWPEKQDHFIFKLADSLDLPAHYVLQTHENLKGFIEKNGTSIPFFNNAHPLKHFYDQTSIMVSTLILRNKKRLFMEVVGSKDLVMLLGKSTYKDLSKEERKKVNTQLLDICKGVPSLAMFLLPGGSILLPLLIHYIPELLPSAFDENRIDDHSEESE
jgi:hypothetical protein